MKGQKAQTVQLPQVSEEVEQELTLLRGFRDLVHEGLGYYFGAKAVQDEARLDKELIAKRKVASDISKGLITKIKIDKDDGSVKILIPKCILDGDIKSYNDMWLKLAEARKSASEVAKPYNERKAPLNKAWKYCVSVALPDSLKELGTPVQPTFHLSEWIAEAIKPKKK